MHTFTVDYVHPTGWVLLGGPTSIDSDMNSMSRLVTDVSELSFQEIIMKEYYVCDFAVEIGYEDLFDELSIISRERSSSEIIDSESNKSSYPIETTKSQS